MPREGWLLSLKRLFGHHVEKIGSHEDQVGRFDRYGCAGRESDTERCRDEGRRVIDSVANLSRASGQRCKRYGAVNRPWPHRHRPAP
jgi:hypothetical protein